MLSNTLKQVRIDSGKTLEQVASDLKIRKLYLEAMEEENLDILPGEVYIKCYLKLYSDYLNVNDPLSPTQSEHDNIPKRKKVVIDRSKTLINYKHKH